MRPHVSKTCQFFADCQHFANLQRRRSAAEVLPNFGKAAYFVCIAIKLSFTVAKRVLAALLTRSRARKAKKESTTPGPKLRNDYLFSCGPKTTSGQRAESHERHGLKSVRRFKRLHEIKCMKKIKYLIEHYKEAKEWNRKQTGGSKKKSMFYDEIDAVLGCRDIVTLTNVSIVLRENVLSVLVY